MYGRQYDSHSAEFRDLGRIALQIVGTQPPMSCHSGVEVLFPCGGAYAGTCNATSGSCECAAGWSGHTDVRLRIT